jgi:hypothetical protein
VSNSQIRAAGVHSLLLLLLLVVVAPMVLAGVGCMSFPTSRLPLYIPASSTTLLPLFLLLLLLLVTLLAQMSR